MREKGEAQAIITESMKVEPCKNKSQASSASGPRQDAVQGPRTVRTHAVTDIEDQAKGSKPSSVAPYILDRMLRNSQAMLITPEARGG